MAIEFFSSIDLNQNQIIRPVIHNSSEITSGGVLGQIYVDTDNQNKLKYHNGSDFIDLTQQGDITGVTLTGGDGIGATNTNSSGGAYSSTISLDAALTTVTSIKNNSLIIGGNSQNNTIDFGTDDVILFDTDNTERMRVDAAGVDITGSLTVSGSYNLASGDIPNNAANTTGTAAIASSITVAAETSDTTCFPLFSTDATGNIEPKSNSDLTFNSNTAVLSSSGGFAGNLQGNASGSAATVTAAAQSAITSLGTLTTLTVDNVIINGTTIGHTSDTDLITLANGKVTITGDLDIIGSGTSTIIESSTVAIADSMLKLAKDQGTSADAVDFGFYGQYGVGGTAKYAGLFRDQSVSGDPFTFFDDLQVEPGTTVNTGGTGYDLADIVAADGNFESLTIPDNAIAVGKIAAGALPSDVTINNDNFSGTDLAIANGGTGQSTASAAFGALKQAATTTATGVVELAADTEVKAGSGSGKVVDATQMAAQRIITSTISASSVNAATNKRAIINHALDTNDIVIELYLNTDATFRSTVHAEVTRTSDGSTASTNHITVDFGTNIPADVNVVIISGKGGTSKSPSYA